MTPAEAARRSRRAQGLPDRVTDPVALDQLAAFIAATSRDAVSAPYGQPSGGGAHGSAAA